MIQDDPDGNHAYMSVLPCPTTPHIHLERSDLLGVIPPGIELFKECLRCWWVFVALEPM